MTTILIGSLIEGFSNIKLPEIDTWTRVLSDRGESAVVTRVIDGDTIEISTGEVVRYIGVDTPEDPLSPSSECYALNSYLKNSELVMGKVIQMEKDVSERDRYGRLLRYVYVDEIFVNLELVKSGHAFAKDYPPDIRYSELFRAAENEARSNNQGLWRTCEE